MALNCSPVSTDFRTLWRLYRDCSWSDWRDPDLSARPILKGIWKPKPHSASFTVAKKSRSAMPRLLHYHTVR